MKYERLTKKAGWHKDIDLTQELGYSYIYQRLSELENKIEDGTLVEDGKPFVKKVKGKYYICGVAVIYMKAFKTKAEAENKLKELQGE